MPRSPLTPARMEAFSDGVIAVIITIMVLEIHVPSRDVSNLQGLREIFPLLLVYLLSFVQTGIYWVNHHYLLDDLEHVTHGILWSNLAMLFTLSLIPTATNWVGTRGISPFSLTLYSIACALPGIPWMTVSSLICLHSNKRPANGLVKQVASVCLYVAAACLSWVSPYISLALISVVAIVWIIPPRRIVEQTRHSSHPHHK